MMTNETYMRDITTDKIHNNPDASLQKMNEPGYMRVFFYGGHLRDDIHRKALDH